MTGREKDTRTHIQRQRQRERENSRKNNNFPGLQVRQGSTNLHFCVETSRV